MLAALAEVLPGLARGVWSAQAACSGSRLLSSLAASTSQQQDGLPFALPEHEIEDGAALQAQRGERLCRAAGARAALRAEPSRLLRRPSPGLCAPKACPS
jgi:hypothetical protein